MKRRLLVPLAGLAVLLAAAVFVLCPRAEQTPINRANFDRIAQDMSPEDVAVLLGQPNFTEALLNKADYHEFSSRRDLDWRLAERLALDSLIPGLDTPGEYQHWNSSEGILSVKFDRGRAVRKIWVQRAGAGRRLLNRTLEWFR